jgi:hypothetical protein
MPTASEITGRANAAEDDRANAIEGIYDSLRSGEARGEEAIATTVHAFTDLLRAAVPAAISQPARFVDLTFEVGQQTMSLQRRLIFEVLSDLQRVMTEPWSALEAPRLNGHHGRGADQSGRTTRRAA